MGSWVACGALAAVVGFCCFNPDGGDYGVWIPQVSSAAVDAVLTAVTCILFCCSCAVSLVVPVK